MPETRSPDELVDAVVALQARLDDLESTLGVRVAGRPTGTIEPTFELNAKAGTLFLQGQQNISRTTYAVLWQWVQDNGLVVAGGFTNGDNSTTFGLPNMCGRVLMGAGTLSPNTYVVGSLGGSASVTLATNQMPAHDHNVSVPSGGSHNHPTSGSNHFTSTDGSHNGHNYSGSIPAGPPNTLPYGTEPDGSHDHRIDPGDFTSHSHTVNETTVGGTTPIDLRQPYIAVNFLIYT